MQKHSGTLERRAFYKPASSLRLLSVWFSPTSKKGVMTLLALGSSARPTIPASASSKPPGSSCTRRLCRMTIEAMAQRAEVSAQSVYAIFKSKTGILIELLNQSTFGADYDEAAQRALSASDPETRLRLAGPIARLAKAECMSSREK
jgi:hypothetical protein